MIENFEISNGAVIRMFFLMTHYRKNINFTEKAMKEAKTILERFVLASTPTTQPPPIEILECLMDDLNTLKMLALMHNYRKNKEGEKLFATLKFLGFFDNYGSTPDDWRTIPDDHLPKKLIDFTTERVKQ